MLNFFLNLLTSKLPISSRLASIAISSINYVYRLRNGAALLDRESKARFLSILTKPVRRMLKGSLNNVTPSIQIIIVATDKDFPLLPNVVSGVYKCCRLFLIESIDFVVPTNCLEHKTLKKLKNQYSSIRIIDEAQVLEVDGIKSIFSRRFVGRENWCLQQFLKYYSVLDASTEFVLVVDADTILLKNLPWLTREGKFLQTPTMEYQVQYYKLLVALGILEELPKFSFVPHHLFYSTFDFRELHYLLGSPSALELAHRIESISDDSTSSPFCIDYELYAQYMFKHKRDKVELIRWANCNISRASFSKLKEFPGFLSLMGILFNSISVHSWNDQKK